VKEHNDIEQLFKDSFDHFEAPVRPEVWSSVSQQLSGAGQIAASTGSGLSIFTKSILGLSAVVGIATATYFGLVKNQDPSFSLTKVTTEGSPEAGAIRIEETNKEKTQDVTTNFSVASDSKSEEINREKATIEMEDDKEENPFQIETERISSFETKDQQEKPEQKDELVFQESQYQEFKKQAEKPIENPANNEQLRTPENVVDPVLMEEQRTRHLPDQLPNSFTPNGDGANDYLQFEVKGLTQFRLEVYSARGELVFVSQETTFRWDGLKMDGTPAPDGRYVYQIEGKDENGNPIKPRVQSLQIIRR
jgi:gliding motility-associated-like protein